MKRPSQIMEKSIFHDDDVIDDVREVGSGSKLQGQSLVHKCEYRSRLSRLYMSKEDLNK